MNAATARPQGIANTTSGNVGAGAYSRGHARSVHLGNIVSLLALAVSMSIWFSAIRAPLWLDETASYWQTSGGLSQVWARRVVGIPAYPFLLALWEAIFGSSVIALRLPSVIAMAGAVYVLYRIARRWFEPDVAIFCAIVFCLHPVVSFAAIDVRPYAFAILVVNCAVLALLHWLDNESTRSAIIFGVLCGAIQYFQYLLAVILLAFTVLLLILKWKVRARFAKSAAIAFLAFFVAALPAMPGLIFILRTGVTHIFADSPKYVDLAMTFDPYRLLHILVPGGLFIAAVFLVLGSPKDESLEARAVPVVLALVPILFLFYVSRETSLHIFVDRYRLVATPGIALCWGFLVSRIRSVTLRQLICIALVVGVVFGTTASRPMTHGYSWKEALEEANAATAEDHAPLLICSDYVESNYVSMPADVSESWMFSPVSYYKVRSRVVPLPRALNETAKSQIDSFRAASPKRFLAVAYHPSLPTILYITSITRERYTSRTVGIYDGISVLEFTRR